MGKLKESLKQETLSGAFSRAVFFMTLLVAAASLTTIALCTAVKNWLVPIMDEVMLHIYTEEQGRMLESSLRMRANAEKFEVPAFYVANDGLEIIVDGMKKRMKKKEILEKPCFVIVKTVKIRYYYKGVTTLNN
ncbi:MAG: hypothetical protein ACLSA6_14130 [Holdemania massiliensis]